MDDEQRQRATRAVVSVGDGRGFIMDSDDVSHNRVVVTAAHCLPQLPPAFAASCLEERTYPTLLGQLDDPEPTVWTECLFADPIADIAVLGRPDPQTFYEHALNFYESVNGAGSISMGEAAECSDAWLLSLDCRWVRCNARKTPGGQIWLSETAESIVDGMFGSPILSDDGVAIGVLVTSDERGDDFGPEPSLTNHLPGWLLSNTSCTA